MRILTHCIDPTVDFVFKKLLASMGHESRTLSFINSVLNLDVPIKKVTLLNPFNDKDFELQKLSVVDIKAEDENGEVYQIEMQVTSPAFLTNRMLHNWSGLYHKQIDSGDRYNDLQPVISIWLLTASIFKNTDRCHHHFQTWDFREQLRLSDHMSIHTFELDKWCKPETLQPVDYWLYFIKDGHKFTTLPPELITIPQMREAMSVLKEISESTQDYYRYQARQEYQWVQRSEHSEKLKLEKKLAEAESKAAEAIEKIKALETIVRNAGLEPPT